MKKLLAIAVSAGMAGTSLMWATHVSAQSSACEKEVWTGCLVESNWDKAKARSCYNGAKYVCGQQPAAPAIKPGDRGPDDPAKGHRNPDGTIG